MMEKGNNLFFVDHGINFYVPISMFTSAYW